MREEGAMEAQRKQLMWRRGLCWCSILAFCLAVRVGTDSSMVWCPASTTKMGAGSSSSTLTERWDGPTLQLVTCRLSCDSSVGFDQRMHQEIDQQELKILLRHAWAPLGVAHFLELVRFQPDLSSFCHRFAIISPSFRHHLPDFLCLRGQIRAGFYTDVAMYRTVAGQLLEFGLSGNPTRKRGAAIR